VFASVSANNRHDQNAGETTDIQAENPASARIRLNHELSHRLFVFCESLSAGRVHARSQLDLEDVRMTQALLQNRSRRTTFGAALIFALAYLGALVFIFAPDGMLSTRAPEAQTASQP
jgi:hypothetical protein